jgi:hypothetical protein
MSMNQGVVTNGLKVYLDSANENSFPGEPTTNAIPNPDRNGEFTTSNSWGSYNTNNYASNVDFDIGAIVSVTDNIIEIAPGGRTIRSYDVLNPGSSGGGVTAGYHYFIKKIDSTHFSLHAYNSSQNGSQGYINPATGYPKVWDSIALDQRVSVSLSGFPNMWHGDAHKPNSRCVKDIVEGHGRRPGTNCMRLHCMSGDSSYGDRMAYGVNTPVTEGDTITVSVWCRAATRTAVGKTIGYSTYFGSGKGTGGGTVTCGAYKEWKKNVFQWTASATYSFISYWYPSRSTDEFSIDIADFQVELNKGHATPFVAGTRSTTEAWKDISGSGSHVGLGNSKFDSAAGIRFNENTVGNAATVDSDFCDITITEAFDLGHIAFWMKPDLMHTKSYLGYYPTLFSWGSRGTISAGPWTGGATDEVFHIWDDNGSMTYTRTNIPAEWNYVVWNWNGSAYDCYINNVQITTYTASNGDGGGCNLIDAGTGTRIGNNFSTYSWRGYMPVVQMYNRGLSETEMTQNFNALRARYGI